MENVFVITVLKRYKNVELSTLKWFRDYPDLMIRYDIRDEYELHNLLKKILTDVYPQFHFKKMPTIEIGNANPEDQILTLLIQYAPISADDLAEKYEEEYGVKAMSLRGGVLQKFNEYYYDGIYSIDYKGLSYEQREIMNKILDKDFYTITEVKQLFYKEFPDADITVINPYTLKTLGFHVYPGYVGYIVRNTYSGATYYFNELLTKDDIVDMRDYDKILGNIVTYRSELYRIRNDYEIIEFSPWQYINIRRLNEYGVTKQTLIEYSNAISNFTEKGEYFTIKSIHQDGFSHSLDDLGFDEWFYSSVLVEQPEKFSSQRLGGTRLFFCGKTTVTIGDMLYWLLEKYQKIDIYDLVQLLENRYGITMSANKLREIIKETELYYDTIMEAVYIDYDTYFEEI